MNMPGKDNANIADWYARAFGPLYPILYAHRSIEAAAPEARFAAQRLKLSPSDSVLDLCCGTGRHMAHLRQNTFRLTGMDYSQNLLDIAHRQLGPSARLVRGDMRALPFDCVFDALTNFFTSFGYFLPEQENCRVLAEIARVLRPGGRFLLDYMNEKQVRASLRPYTERSQEGLVIIEERWIDDCSHRVNKKISVKQGTQTIHEGFESVRLYAPEELLALLRHNGLEIQEVFGNYDGAAFEPDQPRMIVVGSKDTDAQPA